MKMKKYIIQFIVLLIYMPVISQTTSVGSGSYTTQFPGYDSQGRNAIPAGTPQLSGQAVTKPVPTNDWWSKLLNTDHVNNLYNYPFAMETTTSGLGVTHIPRGVIGDQISLRVGVVGLNSTRATIDDHTDWTVSIKWADNNNSFAATSGIGMPFVYLTKETSDVAKVVVEAGSVTVANEQIRILNARNGADFVVYAPTGSTWTQNGNTFTSNLNNQNYWSVAMLPQSTSDIVQKANEYQKYAYVFPVNTTVNWSYNENTSVVRTDFTITTETKEGSNNEIIQGLLPHQWGYLAPNSAIPNKDTYSSIRGNIKMLEGNQFSVEHTFQGILPTLPNLAIYTSSYDQNKLQQKIDAIENDALSSWTDSYNEGQVMNRLIQTARIAEQLGDSQAVNKIVSTIKERLEDWLSYENNEVAFLFYYNSNWSTLFGYPAGHGQDSNINDHHFHWGYFIHAAAFMEQYEPGWASQWGQMVNHLVRDAASPNRNDSLFPFLRNFSPYAGHCWANGFAFFPQGNDQESTSESMQFNSSLIHWGTITGNDEIRDLGIYLYTTEQSAVEEYWFDINNRTFVNTQQYGLISRLWGNDYDNGTFWTADIAASYGIEFYPIHGGSLYLGHNTDYVESLWTEIEENTGILQNEENANLWHDVYWQYLSFVDPLKAINLYDSNSNRSLKFGVSDAQTYHWIHNMHMLGRVNTGVSADYPIAAVFERAGQRIYVAHNYGPTEHIINYSDGFQLTVPARKMKTSYEHTGENINPSVSITSPENGSTFAPDESITISANASDFNGSVYQVEFYIDGGSIATDYSSPYSVSWSTSSEGSYVLTAIVTDDEGAQAVSDDVTILIEQPQNCIEDTSNGDYQYAISNDLSNPTITFIPLNGNAGSPTCILYYGTGSGPYPGYHITPNVPFQINASQGTQLNFYFTYSYDGMERNNSANPHSIVVGDCAVSSISENDSNPFVFYPNPTDGKITLILPIETPIISIQIFNISGKKLVEIFHRENKFSREIKLDLSHYPNGIYFINLNTENLNETIELIKD